MANITELSECPSETEFVLEIPKRKLAFDVEQTSKSGLRLFGEMTGGINIRFERKN